MRTRKRYIVLNPRYTFRPFGKAKSCIVSENEGLDFLGKERRLYRKIMDGPDGPDKEYAKYHTMIGILMTKIKQSDGSYLTTDMVSKSEYTNSRIPARDFYPLYRLGHRLEFAIDKEDMNQELRDLIEILTSSNEIEGDREFFSLIQLMKLTNGWKSTYITECRNKCKELLKQYQTQHPGEIALIKMVTA